MPLFGSSKHSKPTPTKPIISPPITSKPAPAKTSPGKAAPGKLYYLYVTPKTGDKNDQVGFTLNEQQKAAICRQSPFFNQMFGDAEKLGLPLKLKGNPTEFKRCLDWFKQGHLKDAQGRRPDLLSLASVWSLGQVFGCDNLSNAAMDEIFWRMVNNGTDGQLIKFVKYAFDSNVVAGSRSRLQQVSVVPFMKGTQAEFEREIIRMPFELVCTIATALKKQVGQKGLSVGAFYIKAQ